jgi:hypothetical protein
MYSHLQLINHYVNKKVIIFAETFIEIKIIVC